jgi:phosphohistidine phosphatase SixA
LDLIRHGDALAASEGGDAERELSEAGRDALDRMAREYLSRGWRPDRIYMSPLRRARQSAAILAERMAPPPDYEILDALAPECDPQDVVAHLAPIELPPHVVLVGHQPLLGRLVARLTGGDQPSVPAGGLIVLRFERRLAPGAAALELQWRPERAG